MIAEERTPTEATPVSPWLRSRSKRYADLGVAIPLFIVAVPVLIICAVAIKLTSRGPLLFRHQRAGRFGKPFEVLKLRTMRQLTDGSHAGASENSDSARLTPLGRFLRRFSLDELPQLINVIRGDMSIVGPRPLPVSYIDRYSDAERRRLSARPGLTGLSQVTIRNLGDWTDKLTLDVDYVDTATLGLDLRILLRTVRAVVTGMGVQAPGHATMPELTAERSSHN
ncbi:MAG: sugar transferase [Ilumatobacteraceae bacterium]